MDINFENAFSFISEDSQWKSKIAIGGLLSLIMILLFFLPFTAIMFRASAPIAVGLFAVCAIIDTALILALTGYPYQVIYNRINNTDEILPEWKNFGQLILIGFKSCMGYFLFTLPFTLAGGAMVALITLSGMFGGTELKMFSLLISFFLFVILSLLSFFYSIAFYLMMANFSKDLKIVSFVNFKDAYKMLKDNWLNYLILLLLVIAISVILQLVSVILVCTIIGVLFIPATMFYLALVNADIVAQFVKTEKVK